MYKIHSIELAKEISAESGISWYQYVIGNDNNTITGLRAGTLADVRNHSELCISVLNQKYSYNGKKHKPYKPASSEPHNLLY